MRLLGLALLLVGCKGSGVPLEHFEGKLDEKGRLSIEATASVTGGSFKLTLEGPASLKADRDKAPEPEPAVPLR